MKALQLQKVIRVFNRIILILSGIIAVVISVADLFSFLTIPWVIEKASVITLLLIGLFLIGVISLIGESTTRIENKIQDLEGSKVLYFENVAEVFNYVATKIENATKSIDDITWGFRRREDYRTTAEEEAYENYLKAMEAVCKKGNIKYREISSLIDEHYFQRSMNLIQKEYISYHLGYYDISSAPPLMSYIIIDSKEVIIGFYRVPFLSPEGEIYLSITQPEIVKLFQDYFEVLWIHSRKVKEGRRIDQLLIDEIKRKIEGKG